MIPQLTKRLPRCSNLPAWSHARDYKAIGAALWQNAERQTQLSCIRVSSKLRVAGDVSPQCSSLRVDFRDASYISRAVRLQVLLDAPRAQTSENVHGVWCRYG